MRLVWCCSTNNDLFRLMNAGRETECMRFDTAAEAVLYAPEHSGVLLLADRYPVAEPGPDESHLQLAAAKRLRLYVEYPSAIAGLSIGEPQSTRWERIVVASDFFAPSAEKLDLLDMHKGWFVPIRAPGAREHLVAARVAGYDKAIFGLPQQTYPMLLELPERRLLVSAGKLSQFVTGRYGPAEAWGHIWRVVLQWLAGDDNVPELVWPHDVGPRYGEHDPLPEDAEKSAFSHSLHWFRHHVLFGKGELLGAIEGYVSRIERDGRQLQRPVEPRADCIAETALVFARAWAMERNPESRETAGQLLDYVWSEPAFLQSDPGSPVYGLVNWYDRGPIFYGDDNARVILATLAAGRLLEDDRWEEHALRCLLANYRTSGPSGFRHNVLRYPSHFPDGRNWEYYRQDDFIRIAPHYQAYLWACYLWGYALTGYEPLLTSAKRAIRLTMDAYPSEWKWTNGMTQEIARMLLPLAFLVRIEDTREHRGWLQLMCAELLRIMQPGGAIPECIGALEQGVYVPPQSNESYGTREASLLQANGDPVCDLLYTVNFAFLGLHEAGAALDDPAIREAEDRLAGFLCRIQAASGKHPYLDGAWLRSFDYRRWEFWGSSSDPDWGAWCVESGWTNSWIAIVLAMRQAGDCLFNLGGAAQIKVRFPRLAGEMLESSLN